MATQAILFPIPEAPIPPPVVSNGGGNGGAAPPVSFNIRDSGVDLARKTVCIKVRLSTMGNTRKVSTSQIEADADKDLLRVSKHLLDSAELKAVGRFDGEIRRFLYNICLPFEIGIHLLPVAALEVVEERLRKFAADRAELAKAFLAAYQVDEADIVISYVDTRAARSTIEELVTGNATVGYHLDLGNGASAGQYVLGQPLNRRNPRRATRLRTAAELFPEIMDTSLGEDDAPSCSALAALEKQEPFVNHVLASHSLALLARLLRHGALESQGAFVNAGLQRVQPIAIGRPVKLIDGGQEFSQRSSRNNSPAAKSAPKTVLLCRANHKGR